MNMYLYTENGFDYHTENQRNFKICHETNEESEVEISKQDIQTALELKEIYG